MFELILRNGEPGSERGVPAGVRYILVADHLTFEGEGMGDFRKKYPGDLFHGKNNSCKEIPGGKNFCKEEKYFSWLIMLEKTLTSSSC